MRISVAIVIQLLTPLLPAALMGAGVPLAEAKPSDSGKLFDRLEGTATGLVEVNRVDAGHNLAFLYMSGLGGGSIALGDVDGDGRLDVFLAGGAGANRLYLQHGALQFTDVTAAAGGPLEGGDAWATGSVLVDIDADGDLDIFVCNYEAPCQLFINEGPAAGGAPVHFREAAAEYGLALTTAAAAPCFCDYDRDGDLDLYLVTGRFVDSEAGRETPVIRVEAGAPALPEKALRSWEAVSLDGGQSWQAVPAGDADYLLRNDARSAAGGRYFRDVSAASGIAGRGDGSAAVWWDANSDGWMDLYVSQEGHAADVFYQNQHDGTFLKVTAEQLPVLPWRSAVAAVGDFTGDALPDLFAGGMGYTKRQDRCLAEGLASPAEQALALSGWPPQEMRNALYLNSGERFAECAWFSGPARTGTVRGAQSLDADHDGRLDLILLHGQARRFGDPGAAGGQALSRWSTWQNASLQKEPLTAWRNAGDLALEDASAAWGLDHAAAGTALAAGDFDNDGDLDLLATAYDEAPALYLNGSLKQNALTVRLKGPPGNPFAVGTTLIARTDKATHWTQIMPCNGGRGQSDTLATLCLGTDPVVQELIIRWPTGAEQRETTLIGGNAWTFSYPARPASRTGEAKPDPIFTRMPALDLVRHTDATTAEFAGQPLLPFATGTGTPALAWSDADGDGDHDLFMGGSAGFAGQLRLNDGQGKLALEWSPALQKDAAAADAGAVWFDADGDGDADLFVAGGSTGHQLQTPVEADRLYLNDGKGQLHPAGDGVIPQDGQASSIVCVADIDLDGDFDVFTGARAVPGDYGGAAPCQMLRNDSAGGKVLFTSVPNLLDPRPSGMITSAVWSDVDNDSWPDLAITQEWGPVRLYLNRVGKRLEEVTAAAKLDQLTGWWQSVMAVDVDQDGDMDLVAGNAGTNSPHRAPVTGFSLRPAGTSSRVFLLTETSGDRLLPQSSPGVLAAFMPHLSVRFPDAAAFAGATVEEIAGREALDAAVRFDAVVLQSGIFYNTPGAERKPPAFTFAALPAQSQLAPVFGIAVSDFDGDGDQDMVLAQNARNAPPGESQRSGGLGVLLLNDGSGHYEAIAAARSGLASSDEQRACTVADINFDSRPDVVMSAYRGSLAGFTNTAPRRFPILRINLPAGQAPGMRVSVARAGFPVQIAEYAAGGGWLSQNAPSLFFGLGSGPAAGGITVRRADGRIWTASFDESHLTVTVPNR